MKRAFFNRPFRIILIPFAAAAFLGLISLAVMLLWNNLLPGILHVSTITFWQAMGIFILCKILFGFGKPGRFGGGGAPWMRRRMAERFKNMSPEERSRFNEHFGKRCGDGRGRWSAYDWPEEEKKDVGEQ